MMRVVVVCIFGILLASVTTSGFAQTDSGIFPEWIKTTIKFWADGLMTDTEFKNAIEYLIEKQIIVIDTPIEGFDDIIPSDFTKIISGISFVGLDLNGVDFTGATITNVDFSGTDISGRDFSETIFHNINFTNTDLSNSNLSNHDFSNMVLRGTILKNTNLSGTNLNNVYFESVDLTNANLENASMKKTIMKKSILADANLSNANLQQSSISQTRLDGTNLRNAILQDADLSWSMFDNADLTSANLSGVQLDNTNFRLVKFNEANLEGVDFRLAMNHVKSTYGIAVNLPEKDFSINCDPRKMEGVMSNLLNNSVQAVDGQGEIDVTMSSNSKFLTIQVKDSGPGIPDLDLEKIFEPMYTTKTTGTGLGLVICKSIVEQHGGSISVSNKPTTFTITLPF